MIQRIQLFSAKEIGSLQVEINQWLADHKDIEILFTNITSLAKVSVLSSDAQTEGAYAFYILYIPFQDEDDQAHSLASLEQQLPAELTNPRIIESEIN